MKVTTGINSFNAGEVSRLIDCRFDISKYGTACKTLQNALPLVEGGAKKMPGTYFAGSAKDPTKKVRLQDFSFSTDQNYVLEFGDKYIRGFDNETGEAIEVADASALDQYDPATSYAANDIALTGNYVTFDWGSGKKLYISVPYDEGATGLQIELATNGTDVLGVAYRGIRPNERLYIALANSTPASNSADAIQTAIRYAASVNDDRPNGFDMSEWVVVETVAYAASRPTAAPATGAIQTFGPVPEGRIYKALQSNSGNYWPPVSPTYWEDDTDNQSKTVMEIATDYSADDVFALDMSTQSADILFIFHADYPPMKLSRYASDLWKLEELYITGTTTESKRRPGSMVRLISNITNDTSCTVTSPDHGLVEGDIIYINDVIGMTEVNQQVFYVNYIDGDSFYLKQDEGSGILDSSNYAGFQNGSGWFVLVERLFNEAGKYPACGTFFEQRFVLGGFRDYPERVNGSIQGDYYSFISDPAADDYAFQYDLVSNKVDPVLWMVGQNSLILGTASGIWVMYGSNNESLTATNVVAKKQITIGASAVHPLVVNDSLVWLNRITRVFRMMQYVWSSDQWVAPDLTRLARHITLGTDADTSGIIQIAYQQDPYPILWCVRKDGQLIGMTFESAEQVYSWFRVVTDGTFESVCVLPRQNDEDRVWVVVRR